MPKYYELYFSNFFINTKLLHSQTKTLLQLILSKKTKQVVLSKKDMKKKIMAVTIIAAMVTSVSIRGMIFFFVGQGLSLLEKLLRL